MENEKTPKKDWRNSSQAHYHKKVAKTYTVMCMKTTELDIINQLEAQPNKAGYIKDLIRADIAAKSKSKATQN